jgi:hypothetical protein
VPLPPPRDHRIPRDVATALTRRYRDALGPDAERGGLFLRDAVQKLLAQKGCEGLRIYHGRNEDGGPAIVLVGVDGNGNDMTQGEILEVHYPCPPFCPASDDLSL